jgi:hypothetical protein
MWSRGEVGRFIIFDEKKDFTLFVSNIETLRINKSVIKSFEKYNVKGPLSGSIAFFTIIQIGFEELDYLIERLIDKLSQNRIRKKEWVKAKESFVKYIDKTYEDILNLVSNLTGYKADSNDPRLSDYTLSKKAETNALLDLYIDKQIDRIKSRRWEFIWDIIKILASAFLGAAAALLLSGI